MKSQFDRGVIALLSPAGNSPVQLPNLTAHGSLLCLMLSSAMVFHLVTSMIVQLRQPVGIKRNRSVQRVSLILKALAANPGGMGLAELSAAVALHESTTYRLLATLTEEGLVERATDGSGRYQIGLETFRLGSAVLTRLGIGQQVLTFLEELAADTGETVNLAALHGFHVMYLQKVESQHPLRASLTVGSATVPAHCSATGKVLLAHLAPPALEAQLAGQVLDSRGPNTIVSKEELLAELERIRAQGYSIDDLEFAPDIRAVAAPIHDHLGNVIASVAVAGPATRVSLDRAHALVPKVVSISNRISTKLGFHRA